MAREGSLTRLALPAALSLALACGDAQKPGRAPSGTRPCSPIVVASAPPPASASSAPPAANSTEPPKPVLPGRIDGCPAGMLRVEGEYCPTVIERCLEKLPDEGPHAVNRCVHFERPTRCWGERRVHLSFCMDRYEFPNATAELPQVLTSWQQAKDACAKQSKRMCTEDEFNFACEGPEILPYVTGYDRDATKCNIDKPYRRPDHTRRMEYYATCLATPWCQAELARLDQRHRIGDLATCVSWAGIFDLNGNVNEWVEMPGQKYPKRSGIKGGWWGPVRGRCRPTVTFHEEDDYGYEVGFRCCAPVRDRLPLVSPPPASSAPRGGPTR